MTELPDEWQLNGFNDEDVDGWIEHDFDCRSALAWREAKWYRFEPDEARSWADEGASPDEAAQWMMAISETEYDDSDAMSFRRAGKTPTEVEQAGGGLDAAFERARARRQELEGGDEAETWY